LPVHWTAGAPDEDVPACSGRGARLRGESGGRPKQRLEIGGVALFVRALALAGQPRAEPLVLTRRELAGELAAAGAEVLIEGAT
jgi:hypothetical protein